jgi:large subunit ribosomal protein L31
MAEKKIETKNAKGVQPKYYLASVRCSTCGSEYEIGSTVKEIRIDSCKNCHPFYTGKQAYTQKAGRVEKFNKKYGIKPDSEPSGEK